MAGDCEPIKTVVPGLSSTSFATVAPPAVTIRSSPEAAMIHSGEFNGVCVVEVRPAEVGGAELGACAEVRGAGLTVVLEVVTPHAVSPVARPIVATKMSFLGLRNVPSFPRRSFDRMSLLVMLAHHLIGSHGVEL